MTWEWSGKHAEVHELILAVLNPRRSPDSVKQFVEDLYALHRYGFGEQVAIAVAPRNNPYPATYVDLGGVPWVGEVTCGHNPWLRARKVRNLRVYVDANGLEQLDWAEIAHPQVRGTKP